MLVGRADGWDDKPTAIFQEQGGTVYQPPIMVGWVVVVVSMLLGIPLSFVFIGLPIVGLGIYYLFVTLSWKKSVAMVEEGCFDRSEASHALTLCDLGAKYADIVKTEEVLGYFDTLKQGMFNLPKGVPVS